MAVKFVTCENLNHDGIKHGFFMRRGGISTGVYESLNTGEGSNDEPGNARSNRSIAMQSFGFANGDNLYSLNQAHTNKAVILNEVPKERFEADGMVTNTPGIALGILTADCTPILFADKKSGVIGAAHAGWKGAIGGVIENTIEAMEKMGASCGNISVSIGPTIAQKSYEVGPEFYEKFLEEKQNNAQYFIPSVKNGHFMFNLPAYVVGRLENLGLESIEDCGRDTCAEPDNFFSYRRNCLQGLKDYGRNLSVIVIG